MNDISENLLTFIDQSPSVFHVTDNFRKQLCECGYIELSESDEWAIKPNGKYFVIRNDSSLIAFRTPSCVPTGFTIAAAHSDSPTFKIKENPEKPSTGHYIQLSTEKYGGMLMSSWFDRPLSVAGRVVVKEGQCFASHLVNVDRDLLIIPNVAIHMNRTANDGMKYTANTDTYPLFGDERAENNFMKIVAASAGVRAEDILGSDLYLYVRGRGTVLGGAGEYIAAPKLDDLECAYGCMHGFLRAEVSSSVPVLCVFDNEEVGSTTRQGAASAFLRDTLARLCSRLGFDSETYSRMMARSFLVSADNAHAIHPNHPEYADSLNAPYMNGGIVIKYNANQRYTTDAVSAAIFKDVCRESGVPVQVFANRSDLAGGATLGSIADTMVPVRSVDIGLAQLAMHSAYETAGSADIAYLVRSMTVFFGKAF